MSLDTLARRPVQQLQGITWVRPLPASVLRLQFSEASEVFPPILTALKKELPRSNLYPEISQYVRVQSLIATAYGCRASNIVLGSGVDALIDTLTRIFCDNTDEVIVPTPGYPCYADAARFMGARVVTVPLDKNFRLSVTAIRAKITSRTKIIILANPNNPTGNILLSVEEIASLLSTFNGLVIIDEEYYDFSGVTVLPLLKQYDNLIVFRGFSKSYGIAGLRLGVAVAHEKIIDLCEKSQRATQVFEVNRLALAAAESIFRNPGKAARFLAKFQARKNEFEQALMRLRSVRVLPTQTSFTIFETSLLAEKLQQRLLTKKIAMKSMAIYEGVPKNLVITAIPKRKDFARVMKALSSILP